MSIKIYTYTNPYTLEEEEFWDDIRCCPQFCVSQTLVNGFRATYDCFNENLNIRTIKNLINLLYKQWDDFGTKIKQMIEVDNAIGMLQIEGDHVDSVRKSLYNNAKNIANSLRILAELNLNPFDFKTDNINIDQKYLVDIFHNLVESVLTLDIHFRSSVRNALINLAVLINHIDLDVPNKKLLEENVVRLFSNQKFDEYFFSLHYPDFRLCLKVFVDLCENVISKSNYDIINTVLKSKHFFEYENNISHYSIRAFLKSFIKNDDEETATYVKSIIDSFENVNQKITSVGLLFQSLPEGEIKQEIKEYIETHFVSIENKYLLDFVRFQ